MKSLIILLPFALLIGCKVEDEFTCGTETVTYKSQVCNTVQISDQCWLQKNLNVGEMIPGTMEQSDNGSIEKYCYDNDEANCSIYGGLYQWDEMMQYVTTEGTKGICPEGWHLPTDAEYLVLVDNLGGELVAGGAMKEAGTTHWNMPNTGADNSSGFSALPGGYRRTNGSLGRIGLTGYFWTSTQTDATTAWERELDNDNAYAARPSYTKDDGFSIRCLKDE